MPISVRYEPNVAQAANIAHDAGRNIRQQDLTLKYTAMALQELQNQRATAARLQSQQMSQAHDMQRMAMQDAFAQRRDAQNFGQQKHLANQQNNWRQQELEQRNKLAAELQNSDWQKRKEFAETQLDMEGKQKWKEYEDRLSKLDQMWNDGNIPTKDQYEDLYQQVMGDWFGVDWNRYRRTQGQGAAEVEQAVKSQTFADPEDPTTVYAMTPDGKVDRISRNHPKTGQLETRLINGKMVSGTYDRYGQWSEAKMQPQKNNIEAKLKFMEMVTAVQKEHEMAENMPLPLDQAVAKAKEIWNSIDIDSEEEPAGGPVQSWLMGEGEGPAQPPAGPPAQPKARRLDGSLGEMPAENGFSTLPTELDANGEVPPVDNDMDTAVYYAQESLRLLKRIKTGMELGEPVDQASYARMAAFVKALMEADPTIREQAYMTVKQAQDQTQGQIIDNSPTLGQVIDNSPPVADGPMNPADEQATIQRLQQELRNRPPTSPTPSPRSNRSFFRFGAAAAARPGA